MAEFKTRRTAASAARSIEAAADDGRREDGRTLVKLMKRLTGAPAKMRGANIDGFGACHHVCASGREGDWFLAGFSPRKPAPTICVRRLEDIE